MMTSSPELALLELLIATSVPGLAPSLELEVGPTASGRLFDVTPWQSRRRVTLRFAEEALRHPALPGLLGLAIEAAARTLGAPGHAKSGACRAPRAEEWCQATLEKWGAPEGTTVRLTPDGMEVTL